MCGVCRPKRGGEEVVRGGMLRRRRGGEGKGQRERYHFLGEWCW